MGKFSLIAKGTVFAALAYTGMTSVALAAGPDLTHETKATETFEVTNTCKIALTLQSRGPFKVSDIGTAPNGWYVGKGTVSTTDCDGRLAVYNQNDKIDNIDFWGTGPNGQVKYYFSIPDDDKSNWTERGLGMPGAYTTNVANKGQEYKFGVNLSPNQNIVAGNYSYTVYASLWTL